MPEWQQTEYESWCNSEDKITRHKDVVHIVTLSFNSIRSGIIKKLETSGRQITAEIEYKVHTGSDGNLMSMDILKILFSN